MFTGVADGDGAVWDLDESCKPQRCAYIDLYDNNYEVVDNENSCGYDRELIQGESCEVQCGEGLTGTPSNNVTLTCEIGDAFYSPALADSNCTEHFCSPLDVTNNSASYFPYGMLPCTDGEVLSTARVNYCTIQCHVGYWNEAYDSYGGRFDLEVQCPAGSADGDPPVVPECSLLSCNVFDFPSGLVGYDGGESEGMSI